METEAVRKYTASTFLVLSLNACKGNIILLTLHREFVMKKTCPSERRRAAKEFGGARVTTYTDADYNLCKSRI